MATRDELLSVGEIQVAPLRLEVRAVGSAYLWPLVELQSQPLESFNHRLHGAWHSACGIRVFDA